MSLSHSNMNKSPQFSEEANWENFAADFSMYLSLDANGHKLHPQHSLLQVWTYDPIMNCDANVTPTRSERTRPTVRRKNRLLTASQAKKGSAPTHAKEKLIYIS